MLETIARVLSAAWSDDGHVGVRIVVGRSRVSTANLVHGPCQHRVDFRLPDGQAGCLEIGPIDGGGQDASLRPEHQELLDAVSLMLQHHLSGLPLPSTTYRDEPVLLMSDAGPRRLTA